jgi:thiamine biosynthesis protein ThiS
VADLLQELGLGARRVAVERNREIVKKEQYEATELGNGDVLEIIEFVGGGC